MYDFCRQLIECHFFWKVKKAIALFLSAARFVTASSVKKANENK